MTHKNIIISANYIYENLSVPYTKALSLSYKANEFIATLQLYNVDPAEITNLALEEYEDALFLAALKSICVLDIFKKSNSTDNLHIDVDLKSTDSRSKFIKAIMCSVEGSKSWHKLELQDFKDLNNIEYIECRTLQEEALVISLKVKEEVRKGVKTIGVVVGNNSLVKHIETLLSTVDGVFKYTKISLASLAHMNFINLLLNAVVKNFAPLELLSLLKHPYFKLNISISHLEMKYLRGIRKYEGFKNLISIVHSDDKEIRSFLTMLLDETSSLVDVMEKDKFSLHQSLKTLLEAVYSLIVPEAWLSEEGAQFKEHLDELESFSFTKHSINPQKELKQVVNQLIGCKLFRYKKRDDQHPSIVILPLELSKTMSFESVIISSLANNDLKSRLDPYLAEKLGLLCGEDLDTIAYLMQCDSVLITRSESIDSSPQRPSKWLSYMEVVASQIKKIDQIKPAYHYLLDSARKLYRPAHMLKYELPKPTPPLSMRPRDFSVTQVENLIRDPYGVYVSRILKLNKLEDIDMQPTQAIFGNIIHKILDGFNKIYDQSKDHLRSLHLLYEAVLKNLYCSTATRKFWDKRFAKISNWIIQFEAERRSNIAVEVHSEIKGRITLKTSGSENFSLSAKADRVEKLESGASVFDFKTGTLPTKLDVEKGFAPQLSLEGLIASYGGFPFKIECVSELIYIRLGKAKFGSLSVFKPQNTSELEVSITELMSAYLDNESTPYLICPNKKKTPLYNEFSLLERLQEVV